MTFFQRFLKSGIASDPLGLTLCGTEVDPYFCTPRGARVFAEAGVDGIHYCFVRGFGEMVFAVSPMNECGDQVHPLARDFRAFLELLLTCCSADALEQAHGWTRTDFEDYMEQQEPDPERTALVQQLQKRFRLHPIGDPYGYVKALQVEFDYDSIPYTKEYREELALLDPPPAPTPPWRVYWQGGFWSSVDGERPGQEIRLGAPLCWGEDWTVPALYLCRRGLCLLVLRRASAEAMALFSQKWLTILEQCGGSLDSARQRQMEAEHPLLISLTGTAQVNGKTLQCSGGCGVYWDPVQEEGEEPSPMAKSAVEHFGLDPACGWGIQLLTFPWATRRRPKWNGCTVTLKQEDTVLPGPVLEASRPGGTVTFTDPNTGREHTLTVLELEQEQLEQEMFMDETLDFPTHVLTMRYAVEPPLPGGTVSVQDADPGDRPRRRVRAQEGEVYGRHKEIYLPEASNDVMLALADRYGLNEQEAAAVGIIGGVDGPTAVCVSAVGDEEGACTAVSSLHFAPVDRARWQLLLCQHHDQTAELKIEG